MSDVRKGAIHGQTESAGWATAIFADSEIC